MASFLFKRVKNLGIRIVEHAKKVSLPFFDGVPLYDVSKFFWESIVDGALTTRASAIAFNFFVALFPAVIFLFTLIPYIEIPNFQNELFLVIQDIVPTELFDTIEGTIHEIINKQKGGWLSIGFFMALIFSTNGIASMMSAFDATIHDVSTHNWISQRVTSIVLLIILSILLTVAIALLTFGQKALVYFKDELGWISGNFDLYLLTVSKWVVIIALFFFAYSFLYYMAPAKKTKWRFISAGGTMATVLSIIAMSGFNYYLINFNQYNILYGSIGTLLAVLLLMYIMSFILLIGFELNASIYQAHTKKEE